MTQAARDGAMEAWLEILSQRHPGFVWIPKRTWTSLPRGPKLRPGSGFGRSPHPPTVEEER